MRKLFNPLLFLLLVLQFLCFSISAQDCCIEEDIDGSPCESCSPENWDPIFTPDIVGENNVWGNSGSCILSLSGSMDGGEYSAFANTEGITTTISDLIPGNIYAYGFEYANPEVSCFTSDAELVLELDGNTITYPQSSDWTTVVECFTASSTDVTITFTSVPVSGSSFGLSVVDALSCEYVLDNNTCSNCCEIELEYDEMPEVCQGESFEINPTLIGDTGPYQVEWTSVPADGINYLSDTEIINPTFTFPQQDGNEEIEYVFNLRVIEGSCEEEIDISLIVLQSETPVFDDIELCITSVIEDLPEISNDGYTGSWSGGPISDFSDEDVNLKFTINSGQNNCLEEFEYDFYVSPGIEVTFDIEASYCLLDSDFYELPFESEEGYEGNWLPQEFNPENLGPGEYEFIFTGEDPADCIEPFELTITVNDLIPVTFEIPDTLCVDELPYIFPIASVEGETGEWTLDTLKNIYTNDVIVTNLFTPDSDGCTEVYTTDIFIDFPEIPEFTNLSNSLCNNQLPYTYPLATVNGVSGVWLDGILEGNFENDTTITNSFVSTSGSCNDTFDFIFNVVVEELPIFNLPFELCSGDLPFIFPTLSENGISGSWIPATIENVSSSDTTVVGTFEYVNGNCTGVYTDTVSILSRIVPTFEMPDSFCEYDDTFTPDPVSLGNISGIWTPAFFEPSTIVGDSIVLTWVPSDIESCVDSNFYTIYRQENIDYEFTLENDFCLGDDYTFPTQSQNGLVQGNWSISDLSSITIAGTYVNMFTPSEDICAENFSTEFTILDILTPEFDLPEYLCFDDSDFTLPTESLNNISGSWNVNEIVILENIDQVVQLEFTTTDECINPYLWEVYITEAYDVSVSATPPTSCESEDGIIEIEGLISELEFSLDGGNNWSDVAIYDNLVNANYNILIRHKDYTSCVIDTLVTIEGPGAILLDQSIVVNDTDCQSNVGSILVQQVSNDPLEFSIDGGANWQDSPLFSGLASGSYSIEVRPIGGSTCTQVIENVEGPEPIVIADINITDVTSCVDDNGILEINASGGQLLYSIDGGIEFQEDNVFAGLVAGIYNIVIQSENYQNCDIDTIVQLNEPSQPNLFVETATDPTACLMSNGNILVNSSEPDVEFSIDGGNTWQLDNQFNGLTAGIYSLTVRSLDVPDCTTEIDVSLVAQDELFTEFTTSAIDPIGCDATNGSVEIINTSNLSLLYRIEGSTDFQDTPVFDNLSEGEYVIEIISQSDPGCIATVEISLVEQECECLPYQVNFSNSNVTCDGSNLGSIEVFPYLDENILWDSGSTDFMLNDLSAGEYAYTISYQNQECQFSDIINIIQIEPSDFVLEVFPADCTQAENGSINISNVNGGSEPYSYSINGTEFQSSSGFYNLSANSYSVFVRDLDGCITMKEAIVEIAQEIDIILPDNISIATGETVILNPLIEPSSIDSFSWTPSEYILNPQQLIAEVQPQESITYTLSIFYGECVEFRTIAIDVIEESKEVYFANTISLGDSNNNILYPQTNSDNNISQAFLYVYDRWGNLVFENENLTVNDPNAGWNPGLDLDYMQGVYVYMFRYSENENENNILTGTVTVLR